MYDIVNMIFSVLLKAGVSTLATIIVKIVAKAITVYLAFSSSQAPCLLLNKT